MEVGEPVEEKEQAILNKAWKHKEAAEAQGSAQRSHKGKGDTQYQQEMRDADGKREPG